MHQLSARLFAQLLRKLPRFSHVPPSPPALPWMCSQGLAMALQQPPVQVYSSSQSQLPPFLKTKQKQKRETAPPGPEATAHLRRSLLALLSWLSGLGVEPVSCVFQGE